MIWKHKALIMRAFASLPRRPGDTLYRVVQKVFGRLTPDPVVRLTTAVQAARWLRERGFEVEGATFFEVGTGHKPIVPLGFFLLGAGAVITVDLHRRLDVPLTRKALSWVLRNRDSVEGMLRGLVSPEDFGRRLRLVEELWTKPEVLLRKAGITYVAPADAARVGLANESVDYHFSVTVLEHIPPDSIRAILHHARKILKPSGAAIHFIDLSDHFQHEDASISKLNFLQFSEDEWMGVAGNRFAYCNRLRMSDYVSLFAEAGFEVRGLATIVDKAGLEALGNGFTVDARFRDYADEDLCTVEARALLR